MNTRSEGQYVSTVRKSYFKTAGACIALAIVAALTGVLALYLLPPTAGEVIAALSALVTLVAVVLGCAGLLVLERYRRGSRGEPDLFLHLNRSRDSAAIAAATPPRISSLRRWLARRMLGHDLVVGDLVEIRPWAEIRATLDERGCLRELPFMPEMLAMCGQRGRVFRCAHRIFDYRKTRRMRHLDDAVLLVGSVCDGSGHGGCEAACHTIWRSAWLRRVGSTDAPAPDPAAAADAGTTVLEFGTRSPRFVCQLTQLNAASRPIGNRSLVNFLRPLVSGNVAPAAFIVGWLTHLFNELQHHRGGISFPAFEEVPRANTVEEARLKPGETVLVRSSGEIRSTLNDQLVHRGMGFETDMLKHCGGRYRVQMEISKLIDIVTGEMRTMKTPAYLLYDTHFSGERQLFNAQYEPLFWRSAWLQKGD
ncbi:MAG TPA: hypothetical protein VKB34_00185 [Povalibacter sp.]|nr:hypothetical protein [Povalibacter sp.]